MCEYFDLTHLISLGKEKGKQKLYSTRFSVMNVVAHWSCISFSSLGGGVVGGDPLM